VEAVANSKRVAEAMHEYMQSLPMPVTTDYPSVPVVENLDAAAQAEQEV
jgi:glutamate synthase (NADPH/NADH) small chain